MDEKQVATYINFAKRKLKIKHILRLKIKMDLTDKY